MGLFCARGLGIRMARLFNHFWMLARMVGLALVSTLSIQYESLRFNKCDDPGLIAMSFY